MKTTHHILIGSGTFSIEIDRSRFYLSSDDGTGRCVVLQSSDQEQLIRMSRVIQAALELSGAAGPGV